MVQKREKCNKDLHNQRTYKISKQYQYFGSACTREPGQADGVTFLKGIIGILRTGRDRNVVLRKSWVSRFDLIWSDLDLSSGQNGSHVTMNVAIGFYVPNNRSNISQDTDLYLVWVPYLCGTSIHYHALRSIRLSLGWTFLITELWD